MTLSTARDSGHCRDILVLGGSRGSFVPLQSILSGLVAGSRASLFVVQHRSPHSRPVEQMLAKGSSWAVQPAVDGAVVAASTVYVAPPDKHLLLADGVMRVLFGPRENLARPSIDVLFRSAAIEYGPRVIGILLSGGLGDGTAGLNAIRRCGGLAVAQDPADATDPELPTRAIHEGVDHQRPASGIASLLTDLSEKRAPAAPAVPSDLALEGRAAFRAMEVIGELDESGDATSFTCPECEGPLRRLTGGGGPDRYRCHIGHAFSADALFGGHGLQLERALWVAYRTLLERARMLEQMISEQRARGQVMLADSYEVRLTELREHCASVWKTLTAIDQPNATMMSD